MDKQHIGEYLVAEGKITPAQLDRALQIQATQANGTHLPLIGTVLVGMGVIRTDDITFALADQERDRMRVLTLG